LTVIKSNFYRQDIYLITLGKHLAIIIVNQMGTNIDNSYQWDKSAVVKHYVNIADITI